MRRTVVGLGLLLLASLAPAAGPDRSPHVSSEVRSQANAYANQMIAAFQHIQNNYFRKVSASSLAEAAVTGLYEVAREPLPSGTKADLGRAQTLDDVRPLLVAARERLGDAEVIGGQNAIYVSIKALTRVLDPYTGIPNRNDSRRAFQPSPGVPGIGVELEGDVDAQVPYQMEMGGFNSRPPMRPAGPTGPVRIADVLPGGPAQLAGVRPGDVITHVDGRALDAATGAQAVGRLSNPAAEGGGKIQLQLQRSGKYESIHVDLVPTLFRPETVFGVRRRTDNSWDHWLDAKARIGYVRIGFIDSWTDPSTGASTVGTDTEAASALANLMSAGMRGLVLDLRGCPGGFIIPAVKLIGLFVKEGPVATVKSANQPDQPDTKYATSPLEETLVRGIPIIVLISAETVGGGEMIAAALQDNKVGEMAGQRTFGKGSVQQTKPLANTSIQYKMTTGLIYRPNGKPLQKMPNAKPGDAWGVSPDRGLEVPVTADLNKQLKDWMRLQVLRPGGSREPLPLDDPENDPARQFALREMLKRVKN
jgi:C-terminal peptidase prc